VRKVVLNKLNGRFHFKRPVGSLRIVPEERGPLSAAQGPGPLRPWVQCLHISMGLFEGGFPEEKGAAFGAESVQGGFQPVLLSRRRGS